MAIVKVTDYVEAYRLRAQSADIHRMAGRDNKNALTEFANSQILAGMNLSPSDVLVDIGCGDGCLLKMAEGRVSRRIGIVPTQDEQERLEAVLPGATILTGLAQKLPLESRGASKIVCNAVLYYLPSKDEMKAALREMARTARQDARIWIGEIPDSDDYARYRQYQGSSVIGLLWHLLRNDGPRAFLGMIRRLGRSAIGRDQIVLDSAPLLCATPPEFLRLAEVSGLRLERYFRHREIDSEGNEVDSESRYDYVFTKPL
jgi:hypothetical protein